MKDYIIQFSGLKEGFHSFDFQVGKPFFDHFDYSEVTKGVFDVALELEKKTRMLILQFAIRGYAEMPCDRCGEPFKQEIQGDRRLIVKFGEEPGEESEEVIILPETEYKIDISQYLYEFINLMVPVKRIHGDDENGNSLCNPEVIRILEENTGKPETDPRWDALKKLKNNK
jgi:uncharacterized metal-binding protein YceD (DUF177 family)